MTVSLEERKVAALESIAYALGPGGALFRTLEGDGLADQLAQITSQLAQIDGSRTSGSSPDSGATGLYDGDIYEELSRIADAFEASNKKSGINDELSKKIKTARKMILREKGGEPKVRRLE